MKTSLYILFFLTVVFGFRATAQENTNQGIIADPKIAHFSDRYNKTYKLSGYRVQIHSSAKKEDARKARVQFLQLYPKVKAYEIYQQPNFRIRVGNFTSRLEATKFLNEIQKHFPHAYIIPEDKIDIPEIP